MSDLPTGTVAVAAQRAVASHNWPGDPVVRTRMALHTGEPRLRGLADRVEALGGRLEVVSSPATGTRVSAWLPITSPEPGDVPAAVAGDRSGS